MLDEERALDLIYDAVDEINGQLPADARLEKSPGTVLFGDAGVLDSLALVNLLVTIEERISRAGGPTVGLLDHVATGGETSEETMPLRTLGTVAAFIVGTRKACA